ncbi:MAG TPA: DUF6335 family protein [Methylomirabilota bacterium]|nr:DUF6335 family protein [Methylomirabilota bacterium]
MEKKARRARRPDVPQRLPPIMSPRADEFAGDAELPAAPACRLTGGDPDADWERAAASGEEAVGGSVATPDQDVVDEIGEALGVPQAADAEVRTSGEILRDRDRHYWHLARDAAGDDPSS